MRDGREAVIGSKRSGAFRRSRARERGCRGIALVWSAMMLIVMVLVVGLSVDWGKVAWNVHQLQNAADAAALAGAQIVKQDHAGAILRTRDFALVNWADQLPVTLRTTAQPQPFTGDESTLDIILGRWVRYNRTFVPTLDAPNAVKAIARRNTALDASAPPLALVFGPVAGVNTVNAAQEAVAWCNDSGGSGLICLSTNAVPGLYLSGTADLDVDGGGVHVNSTAVGKNSTDGTWISGNALMDAGFLNVAGGITPPPEDSSWEGIFMGGDDGVDGFSVTEGADIIEDPLAAQMAIDNAPYVNTTTWDRLQLPDLIEDGTFKTRQVEGDLSISSTVSLAPGYYPYGIRLTDPAATVTLDPSLDPTVPPIYIFGGARPGDPECGLYINGGNIIGEGVTCYVTKSFNTNGSNFGDNYGVTRLMGNGTILLRSPGDQLRYEGDTTADVDGLEGIAVWQDPTNPNYAHLNGGGGLSVSGTLYFPDPVHVRLEGNLGEAGNQILCGSADILGKAVISVNYDGRNDPGYSKRSCLVQ